MILLLILCGTVDCGPLLYLTITHPDLTYSVHILSQFMQDTRQGHWDAANHLLRYLKSCSGLGIFFPTNNSLDLQVYCDSNWASCPMSHRSIAGYLLKMGQAPVSCKSKKQATVSRLIS